MGLVSMLLDVMFGGSRNVLRDTAEVFRENSEARAERLQELQMAALDQFGAEYRQSNRGGFDRVMDGLNRLPRPMMALGCIGLFVASMADPTWFAARMQSLALVPEPLWWLLGVIVSFYFGARHQAKGQEFQKDMAASLARFQKVTETQRPVPSASINSVSENAALKDWRAAQMT